MQELIEKLKEILELEALSEGRQWRIMRKRIKEDFRASRRKRGRLSEFAGSGCPEGTHYNDKTRSCGSLDKELSHHISNATSASHRAHYSDGSPRIQPHLHDAARAHHAKAAITAYHGGYIDLANDHAKQASHHERIAKKLRNPPVNRLGGK